MLTNDLIHPTSSSSVSQPNQTNLHHRYKILVVGDFGTGKTSIIRQFVEGTFDSNYSPTNGVQMWSKLTKMDDNEDKDECCQIELIEFSGNLAQFNALNKSIYENLSGCFIVFNIDSLASFECVSKWKYQLTADVSAALPCVLIANKCDSPDKTLEKYDRELLTLCKCLDLSGLCEVSAMYNINIKEAVHSLIQLIRKQNSNNKTNEPAQTSLLRSVASNLLERIRNCC